jgi:hypothetical protein
MLISYSHRFIFFHVAKVAGLSIRDALQPYVQEPERFGGVRRPPRQVGGQPNGLYAMWESMLLHAKASEAERKLPPDVFDGFYKFAFVRNPWDWQVSMYHFILKEADHIHHGRVREMPDFAAYLEWVVRTDKPFARGATKLQKDMVADAQGRLLVDFVGRYENLAEDFAEVCAAIGLDARLPHINSTRRRDYQSYYNSHTRRLVEAHFREDIEFFGYRFGGHEASGMPLHRRESALARLDCFAGAA